ncbi:uncharacterized protein LY89DRAFT_95030, partial [Mollisia scopiformis]
MEREGKDGAEQSMYEYIVRGGTSNHHVMTASTLPPSLPNHFFSSKTNKRSLHLSSTLLQDRQTECKRPAHARAWGSWRLKRLHGSASFTYHLSSSPSSLFSLMDMWRFLGYRLSIYLSFVRVFHGWAGVALGIASEGASVHSFIVYMSFFIYLRKFKITQQT